MAGRREAVEAEHAVVGLPHVLLWHGRQLAPERVELVAVEPAGALLEPARVDEMRRPDRRDVYLQLGMLAHEHARGAGVVEVDVREQQVAHVVQFEPAQTQALLQHGHAGGGPAVEERRSLGRLQQVDADHPLAAEVQEVERVGCDHVSILWPGPI